MEALAQQVQDALGPDIPVYLGSEWLERQSQLPHVVVVPGGGTYRPPDGTVRLALAQVDLQTTLICKAALFEEAVLLAEAVYAAAGLNTTASIRLRSEVWGDYTVRVADLTLTQPAVLTRDDVTRVRVATFTQDARFLPSSPTEVPDDQTNRPDGVTHFTE